jgi:hypothetical protein
MTIAIVTNVTNKVGCHLPNSARLFWPGATISHNPIHRWWGGTELTNDRLWRWDAENGVLIAP